MNGGAKCIGVDLGADDKQEIAYGALTAKGDYVFKLDLTKDGEVVGSCDKTVHIDGADYQHQLKIKMGGSKNPGKLDLSDFEKSKKAVCQADTEGDQPDLFYIIKIAKAGGANAPSQYIEEISNGIEVSKDYFQANSEYTVSC